MCAVFKKKPSSVSCPPNDPVNFTCSVNQGEILWFVNGTFVLGLSPNLNASFKTNSLRAEGGEQGIEGETSTLQLIARTEANNSQIVCAVGLDNQITERSEPAMLTGEKVIISPICMCALFIIIRSYTGAHTLT